MNAAFVDTSFVLAMALANDELHAHASEWNQLAPPRRVVTEYVLLEVADSLCNRHLRSAAMKFIHILRKSPGVEVVVSSPTLFQRGMDLFDSRPDKDWSLTDCISFVVMEDRSLKDALSADHHFEQAGFRALLRLPAEQA